MASALGASVYRRIHFVPATRPDHVSDVPEQGVIVLNEEAKVRGFEILVHAAPCLCLLSVRERSPPVSFF